jgi:hypothetical protein
MIRTLGERVFCPIKWGRHADSNNFQRFSIT